MTFVKEAQARRRLRDEVPLRETFGSGERRSGVVTLIVSGGSALRSVSKRRHKYGIDAGDVVVARRA